MDKTDARKMYNKFIKQTFLEISTATESRYCHICTKNTGKVHLRVVNPLSGNKESLDICWECLQHLADELKKENEEDEEMYKYETFTVYRWPWSQRCIKCTNGLLATADDEYSGLYRCLIGYEGNDGLNCLHFKPKYDKDGKTISYK